MLKVADIRALAPEEMREKSIRLGKVIRKIKVDGVEKRSEKEFRA